MKTRLQINKLSNKQRKERINFTISESTITALDKFLSESPMNKSKLVEILLLKHIKENCT